MSRPRILVVDDEESLARVTQLRLEQAGYSAGTATSAAAALEMIQRESCDLVITDLKMPGMSGLDLLKAVKEGFPEIIVIVVTAFGTIESAVEAMRLGAYDYIIKPVNAEALKLIVARALEHHALKEEVRLLRAEIELLMSERESLLRTVGAAAVFVAKLDSSVLPEDTYEAADVLAHALNGLPEESLRDALDLVRPDFEDGKGATAE